MRQIVLDTETTGLEPAQGHRIIEIGCVELVNRRLTGNTWHQYICPEREIDEGAIEVHGITNEFLADKPLFAEIVDDFLSFVDGAELVIHNAPFDVGFINHELNLLDPPRGPIEERCRILDTLTMAREMHPGQRNTLDALCKRYEVDNSARDLHGALLDARILTQVYLAMTGGQASLVLGAEEAAGEGGQGRSNRRFEQRPGRLRVIRASEEELAAHRERLQAIDQASGGQCRWLQLEGQGEEREGA
ncbi:MAG: DNA polymerase III subunit epsilon [Gammaproteobacteria bacterium]|nr:MAG: DNA polymerase III subunit epsilon [Gammaproteobacteria bacterium]